MAPATAADFSRRSSFIVAPAATADVVGGSGRYCSIVAPAATTDGIYRLTSESSELKQGEGDEFKHGERELCG